MEMIKNTTVFLLACLLLIGCAQKQQSTETEAKLASKPLFRDQIYDGAADPVVIYNNEEERWFMFYTNRRANLEHTDGVDWVHGTPIGIAESTDGGATWTYRCDAKINYGADDYSFWAPDVICHNNIYHMFLTVVPGTFSNWSHPREIVHLTSDNLIDWNLDSQIPLASNHVIDAGLIQAKDGTWYMFYNNEQDSKSIYLATSPDLYKWEDKGKIIGDKAGEGPKVFYWKDRYFMIVDVWDGQNVYSSTDMKEWVAQPDRILQTPGKGEDDGTNGLHADVLVNDRKAYIFYFTHPGRASDKGDSYGTRRSSIQVVELECSNGKIMCDRDKPVYINLKK